MSDGFKLNNREEMTLCLTKKCSIIVSTSFRLWLTNHLEWISKELATLIILRHNRLSQIFAIQSVAMDKISTNKTTLQSSAETLVSYLCTQF